VAGNICAHKLLFPNVSWFDAAVIIFCFIGAALCAQSGIGGGGLFVPSLLLIGRFSPTLGTALSKVTIFGSSVANFISFGIRKNPKGNKPLIEYEVVLLMEPIILLGTVLGVYLNLAFPGWLILALLLCMIAFTIYKTVQTGIKQWKKEKQEDLDAKKQSDAQVETPLETVVTQSNDPPKMEIKSDIAPREDQQMDTSHGDVVHPTDTPGMSIEPIAEPHSNSNPLPVSPTPENTEPTEYHNLEGKVYTDLEKAELAKMISDDSSRVPYFKFLILFGCWSLLLLMSLFKGGSHGIPSIIGLQQCSVGYWFVVASIFPVFLIVSALAGFYLKRRYERKVYLGYPFIQGDIVFTAKTSFLIPLISLLAGVISGLLGLGGGMITNPILMDLGSLPEVIVSSSAFMILITSSATVAQFAIAGVVPWDYGLVFWCVGFFGSLLGQFVITYVVKRWGRPSWIIFLLIIVIVVSAIALVAMGIYNTIMDVKKGEYLGFKSPC
jgi:uncharacterized membrane protein YfcA